MTQDRSLISISQDDKLRLDEYLVDAVITGISGRDHADVLDTSPTRSIFAGVLQPIRKADIQATQGSNAGRDAPAGTSLGLDFRLKPSATSGMARMRILAQWSHYYAVFPTWEQVSRANEGILAAIDVPQPVPPQEIEYPLGNSPEQIVDDDDSGGTTGADSEAEGTEDNIAQEIVDTPKTIASGRAILPRVFRRHDVEVGDIMVDLTHGRKQIMASGEGLLTAAIEQARSAIQADRRRWRHLGAPKDHVRELGDAKVLASPKAYQEAISSVVGEPVDLPPWSTSLQVETMPDPAQPDMTRVRVLLSNTTPEGDQTAVDLGLEERALFDVRLIVEIEDGAIVPFDFLLAPKDYRSNPELPAKGINCIAEWEPAFPSRLATQALPIFRQPLYRTRDAHEVRFETLDSADAIAVLERLAGEMEAYLAQWDAFLTGEAQTRFTPSEHEACARDRDQFASEIQRYRLGIETLRRDSALYDAFTLMNRTFARIGAASGGRVRAWRLFQIGFIVSQLPSLAVRQLSTTANDAYAQSLRELINEVGVLWFPTGGGKTEAYLGLLGVALCYDRLRGKERGVCAWMRFPLRMLSLQQLERLARVIASLNLLRAEEPRLRTGDPFAIGYFVGNSGATPNNISEEDMRRYEQSADAREEARLIRKCPFCSSRVEIKPIRTAWRLAHVCTNPQCFSNTADVMGAYRGSLPICVVDNEIYRYLPAVLVGTVDKLAIIGRSREFAHIVRGVTQRCPVHGYASYGECIERWNGCKLGKRGFDTLEEVTDPGLSLLIQDELHLLQEELGVFNGHYEGLLRYLGERVYLAPKVLAATATIEAYDNHAFQIYLSRAWRYPQPAWEQGESFYATSHPLQHRRTYVGILCHTRAVEDPTLQTLALYQREIRRLKADPRKAAAIMDRPDCSDDEILDTLRLYDLSLAYVGRKATGGSLDDKLRRVDKYLAEEHLGTLQSRLLTGDQTVEYIGSTLERIERERADTGEQRLDVVIATNLISHGVDLERINMMVMAGMPSHYAEYVQSSSRAARSHPGAIFVCFRARDPRELSQYELFPAMHEHMDRLIEAVAVNRFASFAPSKTVPGLLSGLLLCDYTPRLYKDSKIKRTLDHIPTLKAALGFQPANPSVPQGQCITKESLQLALDQIIGVDTVHPPASPEQVTNVKKRVAEQLTDDLDDIGRSFESRLANVVEPLVSFRQVDEGLDFGSLDSGDIALRLRAR